jgi:hypothetical protein
VYHYYPTRQPILIRETDLRIVRRLPVQGEVTAKVGDRVEPSAIIAIGEQIGRPILVNVARDLGLEPGEAEDRLVREPGQAVTEGEALARRRRGLRTQTVRSPVSGTFIRFDPLMGTALIRPATSRIELPAYVSGVVEEVEQARGVTVRAFGSRFYGAFGVGEETFGVLKMVGGDRQRPLGPDQIDSRSARSVLAVGGTVNAAALTKAVQVGVRGIIAGAIEEAELASFLQAQDGTLWRVGLPDWKLPNVSSALTLVITEGFGRTPMAPPIYETLVAGDGMQVSLCGETRLAGGLSRPEVIVPSRSAGRTGEDSGLPLAALEPGATVRLLDQDHLGVLATVAEEPRRQRLSGDLVLDALAVTLADGQQLRVPTANVEVLL